MVILVITFKMNQLNKGKCQDQEEWLQIITVFHFKELKKVRISTILISKSQLVLMQ